MVSRTTQILILLAAICGMATYLMYRQWRAAMEANRNLVTYATQKDAFLTYYVNEYNKEVAKKDAVVLEYSTFKKLAEDNHLEYLKNFEGLKRNLKNLEVATNINSETIANLKGGMTDTTYVVDSTAHRAFSFNISDEWMEVKGVAIPDLKEIRPSVRVNVPIQGVMYWERKKILGLRLGRKKYSTEFTSPNPYTKITNTEQIIVKRR